MKYWKKLISHYNFNPGIAIALINLNGEYQNTNKCSEIKSKSTVTNDNTSI